MLLDKGTTIAVLQCKEEELRINVKLVVNGEICIEYLDRIYENSSEFPAGLVEIIKNVEYWECHKDLYVFKHNWFEYIFAVNDRDFEKGIMFENNLSQLSVEQLKVKMFNYVKWYLESL